MEGNPADPSPVAEQIKLLKQPFAVSEGVFIGARGRIKAKGKEALGAPGWRYISALTQQQSRALLKRGVRQPALFDEDLGEVEQEDNRQIVRRQEGVPRRERARRADKLERLQAKSAARNAFVRQSTRADPGAGRRQLGQGVKRHKRPGFVTLSLGQEQIHGAIDQEKWRRSLSGRAALCWKPPFLPRRGIRTRSMSVIAICKKSSVILKP